MATMTEINAAATSSAAAVDGNPLDNLSGVRAAAMNAGQFSQSVMQEVTQVMAAIETCEFEYYSGRS